jgi:hypothetical protein
MGGMLADLLEMKNDVSRIDWNRILFYCLLLKTYIQPTSQSADKLSTLIVCFVSLILTDWKTQTRLSRNLLYNTCALSD